MSNFLETSFNTWYNSLFKTKILDTKGFKQLGTVVMKNYLVSKDIFPRKEDLFNAFKYCNYEDLAVVIVGQDPYHDLVNKDVCRATGLAFGNSEQTISLSPSLKNIIKEVESQYPDEGLFIDVTLQSWANQGVLLLNTSLTVEKGKPGSHVELWSKFTEKALNYIAEYKQGIIFVLWGKHAQNFEPIIEKHVESNGHWILKSAHPSPFSANKGFFGNGHFKKINNILYLQGRKEIKWRK